MSYGRPANYPYPREFKNIKDVEDYSKKLYAAMIENDRVGEAATRPVMNRQGWVFPQDYGAKGDGVADDTTAIKSCLAYACSVSRPVFFPAGTYLITPSSTASTLSLPLTKGILIQGAGVGLTIIKIKASAGDYYGLIGSTSANDLTNLEITGITFDGNESNNHRAATPTGNLATRTRGCIVIGPGDNIRIHDNEFTNWASVQVVAMSSSSGLIEGAWITNNRFSSIGDTATSLSNYDTSTIYVHGKYARITGNTLLAAGVLADGTRTAIETHGNSQFVSGNTIVDFQKGFNITGVDIVDNKGIIVTGNNVRNCKRGVQLWGYTWAGSHTTGYGIDGAVIQGNIIEIGNSDTVGGYGSDSLMCGIEFASNGDYEMAMTNIAIMDNVISSPLEDDATVSYSSDYRGIGFRSTATTETTISNMIVARNILTNLPMSGIRFQCKLSDVDIVDNRLYNCGSCLDSDFAATSIYRSPIVLICSTINRVNVSNNTIIDTGATTYASRPIYLYKAATTAGSGVNVTDNVFVATGSGFANQIYIDNTASDPTYSFEPFVIGVISGFVPTSLANQKFALGSMVLDPSDGHWFVINSNQYTWNEEDTYRAPKFSGIELLGGANRTINMDADVARALFLCGGTSTTTGASFQAFGGDYSGDEGNAYIVTGTSTSDRSSKLTYGHRNTPGSGGYADVLTITKDGLVTTTGRYRTATSKYRRYYHIPLGSSNPGASGATWVDGDANTTGGWQLNAAGEKIRGGTDIHADWDGASDMKVEVRFNVNVDNTGGAAGDTVDLKLVCYYKGIGDTATKTQTVEVPTTVGASAQYKAFKADFTLDYDAVSNVLEVGDHISFYLNLETDTSEVDDVIVTGMSFSYLTTHIGIEDGDE